MSKNNSDFDNFSDLSIKDYPLNRKAYRASPKNLWVYLDGDNKPHKVFNISFSGICFKFNSDEEQSTMHVGKCLILYLFSKIHDDVLTIAVQIVRIDKDVCSCFFPTLIVHDVPILDKIVLEIQKEIIIEKKKENLQKVKKERLHKQALYHAQHTKD